jgi:hypothetical protein
MEKSVGWVVGDIEKSVGWVVEDRDDQNKGPEKNLRVRPVLLYAIFI